MALSAVEDGSAASINVGPSGTKRWHMNILYKCESCAEDRDCANFMSVKRLVRPVTVIVCQFVVRDHETDSEECCMTVYDNLHPQQGFE